MSQLSSYLSLDSEQRCSHIPRDALEEAAQSAYEQLEQRDSCFLRCRSDLVDAFQQGRLQLPGCELLRELHAFFAKREHRDRPPTSLIDAYVSYVFFSMTLQLTTGVDECVEEWRHRLWEILRYIFHRKVERNTDDSSVASDAEDVASEKFLENKDWGSGRCVRTTKTAMALFRADPLCTNMLNKPVPSGLQASSGDESDSGTLEDFLNVRQRLARSAVSSKCWILKKLGRFYKKQSSGQESLTNMLDVYMSTCLLYFALEQKAIEISDPLREPVEHWKDKFLNVLGDLGTEFTPLGSREQSSSEYEDEKLYHLNMQQMNMQQTVYRGVSLLTNRKKKGVSDQFDSYINSTVHNLIKDQRGKKQLRLFPTHKLENMTKTAKKPKPYPLEKGGAWDLLAGQGAAMRRCVWGICVEPTVLDEIAVLSWGLRNAKDRNQILYNVLPDLQRRALSHAANPDSEKFEGRVATHGLPRIVDQLHDPDLRVEQIDLKHSDYDFNRVLTVALRSGVWWRLRDDLRSRVLAARLSAGLPAVDEVLRNTNRNPGEYREAFENLRKGGEKLGRALGMCRQKDIDNLKNIWSRWHYLLFTLPSAPELLVGEPLDTNSFFEKICNGAITTLKENGESFDDHDKKVLDSREWNGPYNPPVPHSWKVSGYVQPPKKELLLAMSGLWPFWLPWRRITWVDPKWPTDMFDGLSFEDRARKLSKAVTSNATWKTLLVKYLEHRHYLLDLNVIHRQLDLEHIEEFMGKILYLSEHKSSKLSVCFCPSASCGGCGINHCFALSVNAAAFGRAISQCQKAINGRKLRLHELIEADTGRLRVAGGECMGELHEELDWLHRESSGEEELRRVFARLLTELQKFIDPRAEANDRKGMWLMMEPPFRDEVW